MDDSGRRSTSAFFRRSRRTRRKARSLQSRNEGRSPLCAVRPLQERSPVRVGPVPGRLPSRSAVRNRVRSAPRRPLSSGQCWGVLPFRVPDVSRRRIVPRRAIRPAVRRLGALCCRSASLCRGSASRRKDAGSADFRFFSPYYAPGAMFSPSAAGAFLPLPLAEENSSARMVSA